MVVQALNPSTWETESLYLYEFEASLFFIERSSLTYGYVVIPVLENKIHRRDPVQGIDEE